ncbi:MAG: TIGR03013 family PEP-CTERM/XrtA system glycosyltransferase [Oleiphilaceae bacterium]|nr:TIGR03013 family PEP-CTERM/XrtA system glycosyltransferase [Oleiphilaceae bacterium]
MAHVRVFRHYIHLPFVLLGLLDLLALVAAFTIAVFFRYFGHLPLLEAAWPFVLPSAMAFGLVNLVVMQALGVHQAKLEEGLTGMMLRTILALILSLPLVVVLGFLMPDYLWYLTGDKVLPAASVFGFFLLGIGRTLFFRLAGEYSFKRRVLVIGTGHRAAQLQHDLTTPFNRKGFRFVGFINGTEETPCIDRDSILTKNPDEPLKALCARLRVQEIVVAVDDRRQGGLPMEQLLECRMAGVKIIDAASFYERESRKVALEMITPGWLVFSDGFSLTSLSRLGKRSIDFAASLLLLLVTWPVMLVTAMAIKLEDGLRAPVFYSQERVGLNGQVFRVHKFRSMTTDAEKGGAVWARKNDTRVTRVGAVIRKLRVDELPQIFNVLKGEMAFVGPRPERPVFVTQLSQAIPFYTERHRTKPGITGWAQLCFAYADNEEDSREKLRYDLYYIKNRSLLLDILIILQTVEVVLFKKGSR